MCRRETAHDRAEFVGRDGLNEIAAPQRKIEIGMFAAEETDDADRARIGAAERPQEGRIAGAVKADNDKRRHPGWGTNVPLPGLDEVETLVRRLDRVLLFQPAPDRFHRGELIEYFDARKP